MILTESKLRLVIKEELKKYLVEAGYSRPYSDPNKVKIISEILYYSPEGGRLFLVAEFEEFVGGPIMKFGFYTSRGESVEGTEDTAGSWFPIYGIDETGWIMKIPHKYADKDSLLGMVGTQLTKLIPPAKQLELRQKNKLDLVRYVNNAGRQGKDKEKVKEEYVKEEISKINTLFKKYGVYKKAPKEIKKDELEAYEQEFEPKSSSGSSIR
jgi:hypothetical protein